MSIKRMRIIASSEGVKIYCPEEGKFSFFNSPYPAHYSCRGIDIYPKKDFGNDAPSPVVGEVTGIRRVNTPRGKGFQDSDHDFVILLQDLNNTERVIKILHIKPTIEIGEVIKPGQCIGHLIRSGFFNFWTEPHIHVEIRKKTDPIRARGGLRLKRQMNIDNIIKPRKLDGTISESKPEYVLVTLHDKVNKGIALDLGGEIGVIDGGIPHYRFFGIHTNNSPILGKKVTLCGKEIGIITKGYQNMGIADNHESVFTLEKKPVWISFFFYVSSTPDKASFTV